MSETLPVVYRARHGESPRTLLGQHTGFTDLPLTERGERNVHRLAERLKKKTFAKVLSSPLQRAVRTCELAGFGARVEHDLLEWSYGEYEGPRRVEIHAERPDWQLFRDVCPGGELPQQFGTRADAVVKKVRENKGDVLIFFERPRSRVLAAPWPGLGPIAGKYLLLSLAMSAPSYEHKLSQPAIQLWNDTDHLAS
jgi:probable phosphoglycerate mutase